MPGQRSEDTSVVIGFVAASAMILCLIWVGTSEAAQDSPVNCNEVMLSDRCACNERVLHALTQSRPIVVDPTQSGDVGEANTAIAIQQERQHLLRTFYAPTCGLASPKRLPLSAQHTGAWLDLKAIERHLKPLGAEDIDYFGEGLINPDELLVGRWEGWQTLFGGKPRTVSFHVISVGQPRPLRNVVQGHFVKACSDQGMVFGRLREEGYVELPRSDSSGLAYSIRLWRSSVPRSRDLEGVALLEVRPGEVLVAGLVWLSRALKFDWTAPPSGYFCQDRDLEEQRKNAQEEQQREERQRRSNEPD